MYLKKIEEGDIRGAIRLTSSDEVIAQANEKTLAALCLKHSAKSSTFCSWLSNTVSAENVTSMTSLRIEPEDSCCYGIVPKQFIGRS